MRIVSSSERWEGCHKISSFDGLGKWVFNLLASVNGRDEDEKSPTGDDEAKRAGRFVAFVVYMLHERLG